MGSFSQIIKNDTHPSWLLDAIILSAAVYGKDPKEELEAMNHSFGLPAFAQYEFVSEDELNRAGLVACQQTFIVVKSLARGHYIVACRGTSNVSDALTDLKIVHRSMSLGDGAAHTGFLERAKSIPLAHFRRLLIRNEKVVFTGHSLGGAVASLLTLRLLESTGRWCHEQVQCYTFGCPFFADYRLAKYINSHYKRHFIHFVSGGDFVPKAMPVLYMLYNLWAGLHVGPLEDMLHCSRVLTLALQVMKMKWEFSQYGHLLGMASEAVRWLPGLLRFSLHRLLAFALSFHSGYGYAFAGHMMLLDPQTSAFELEDRDQWSLNAHLNFLLGGVSLDVVRDHSLLSYIEHIFAIHKAEEAMAEACTAKNKWGTFQSVLAHVATIDLQICTEEKTERHMSEAIVGDVLGLDHDTTANGCQDEQLLPPNRKMELKGIRAFRSQVACVIFARRLQEALPKNSYLMGKRTRRGFRKFITNGITSLSRFMHRFDKLLLGYSIVCVSYQLHRLVCRT